MTQQIANKDFVGYEYKELTAKAQAISFYLDSYQSFGWQVDENLPQRQQGQSVTIQLKRDRHLINKTELTRLQRNFEACVDEVKALERAKSAGATALALVVGLLGTAFVAGSVFAVTAAPPLYLLCILLAVPGFLGWIMPVYLYRWQVARKTRKVAPLIEAKMDEMYALCERGHQLLHKE